jgi:hypothetical protein
MRLASVALMFGLLMAGCGGGQTSSTNGGGSTGGGGGTGGGGNGGGGGITPGPCSGMATGNNASLSGYVPFPTNNAWNQDISTAAVDGNSGAIINFIGPTIGLHADFGAGLWNGSPIGIPYVVVNGPAKVAVNFTAYGDESDPGPMPIPANAPIEGAPDVNGDRHVVVIDKSNCWLYELGRAFPVSGGWNADVGTVWDLQNYEQRPLAWTSADAAGLPIFPGLVRYDEVAAGKISHAIRFTLQRSKAAFLLPATHWAANSSDPNAASMGMRIRLKTGYDISRFSAANQVILTAMKKYGMIMADNGSSMFITGAPDERWNNSDLQALSGVKASDFEVVRMDTVYTSANLPHGSPPTITGFTSAPDSASAKGVVLSWTASNASYYVISPQVGAVRGTSVVVTPTATTTYTLYATNQYGRTEKTVVVTAR